MASHDTDAANDAAHDCCTRGDDCLFSCQLLSHSVEDVVTALVHIPPPVNQNTSLDIVGLTPLVTQRLAALGAVNDAFCKPPVAVTGVSEGGDIIFRPLVRNDYAKGHTEVLSQLTTVGNVTETLWTSAWSIIGGQTTLTSVGICTLRHAISCIVSRFFCSFFLDLCRHV